MAHDDHHPGDHDPDRDVTDLLQQTFCRDAARDEFVASLRDALRLELQAGAGRDGDSAASAKQLASVNAGEACNRAAGPSAVSFPRRRRTGRSFAAASLAVVVVLVVAVWSSRPSYSWTSMLRAMEAQPWIESVSGSGADESVRNWFSRVHRVAIRLSDREIVWDDLAGGVRSQYRVGSDVLEQSRLEGVGDPSVDRLLVSFLLRQFGMKTDAAGQPVAGRIEVMQERWRRMQDGNRQWIELEVELAWSESAGERLHLVFRVDPDSSLPQSCRVVGPASQRRPVIQFDYPREGPRQVYELGVPRTVVVHDATGVQQVIRVAETSPRGSAIGSPAPQPQSPPDALMVQSKESIARDAERSVDSGAADAPALAPPSEAAPVAAPPPVPQVPSRSASEMARRIDELMLRLWDDRGITPVGECNDLEFQRRVYLDLTGRVPTVSEVREYLANDRAGRRERLVEQLLGRRDHATHLAAVWRGFLLPEGVDLSQYGGTESFEQWLTDRFRRNVPYDSVVRELLLAEGRVSESGPILFYTALKMAPEALAAQTARAFMGMRLECAQCHDHFFDSRWKQEDFWGYAAFFARISRPEGKMEMISPVLQVKDTNWGDVTLPDREEIVPPRYPLGELLREETSSASRRQELAEWMTAPDNPHFSRATVNRVWAHLFGRGLVDPVDDMRSDVPAVCPEVLDELAGHFVGTGFDLRELFRVIVNSGTYQRSSGAADDDPSRALHFAQMNIKSFTAEQLYDSIAVATRLEAPAVEDGSLRREHNVTRASFLEQFRAPPGHVTDFQAGIPQALTLMNGRLIQTATDLRSSGILRALEAPFFSNEQRVEALFLATLSRPPDEEERQSLVSYVAESDAGRSERLSDILWALLNSAEFTLNH